MKKELDYGKVNLFLKKKDDEGNYFGTRFFYFYQGDTTSLEIHKGSQYYFVLKMMVLERLYTHLKMVVFMMLLCF